MFGTKTKQLRTNSNSLRISGHLLPMLFLLPPAYVVRREGTVFTGVCLLTFRGGGGSEVTDFQIGWSNLGTLDRGGSQVSDFRVGWSSLGQGGVGRRGGSQVSDFRVGSSSLGHGGGPHLSKGGKFLTPDLVWYMFRLEKKFFCRGTPP